MVMNYSLFMKKFLKKKKEEEEEKAPPEINHKCFGTSIFIYGCGEAVEFCMNIIFA